MFPGGSGMPGSNVLIRSASASRPSPTNWWSIAAVNTLLIEPIWKSVSGVMGERASALAKPKFIAALKPSGAATLSVKPGRPKCCRCASPYPRIAASAAANFASSASAGAANWLPSAMLSAPPVNARLLINMEIPLRSRCLGRRRASQARVRRCKSARRGPAPRSSRSTRPGSLRPSSRPRRSSACRLRLQ